MRAKNVSSSSPATPAIILLSVCSCFALVWGVALASAARGRIVDFKDVYYGERCFVQHRDPYNQNELLRVYFAEGGERPAQAVQGSRTQMIVACQMYLPSAVLLIAPFGLLPWPIAYLIWIGLTACGITAAAVLMWQIASRYATGPPLYLILFVLLNSGVAFAGGNAAGVVVSLAMIAAWCFLEDRHVTFGIICLALGLAIKPHDAGPVWLYFLLACVAARKRALKSLAIAAVIGVIALVWVQQISPHWLTELRQNLQEFAVPGSYNDPGPVANRAITTGMIIDLQSVTSVIRDDPAFYNTAAYLLCAPLFLYWGYLTIRSQFSRTRAWFALGAIAPLAMLPVYHRPYDAKLLLLAIPMCAILWSGRKREAWLSVVLTSLAVVFTSDLPLALLSIVTKGMQVPEGPSGAAVTILLLRPAPLALLLLSGFNLLQYGKACRIDSEESRSGSAPLAAVTAAHE